MRRNFNMAILAAISLFIMLLPANASPFIPETSVTLSPGSQTLLTLTLINTGTSQLSDVAIAFGELDAPLEGNTCPLCDTRNAVTDECNEYPDSCFTSLGSIEASGSRTMHFSVSVPESASPGEYLARFAVNYLSGSKKTIYKYMKIIVEDRPDMEIADDTLPEYLLPASEYPFSFKVVNNEKYPVRSVELTLPNGNGLRTNATRVSLGDILPESHKTVSLVLMTTKGIQQGLSSLPVQMNFTDSFGNRYSSSNDIYFSVDGNTSFDIILDDIYPIPLYEDERSTISIGILNKGLLDAEALKIVVNDADVSEPRKYFLGDLAAGDYDTASFYILPPSSGEKRISLEIEYTNSLGQSVIQEAYIDLEVFRKEVIQRSRRPLIYIGLAAAFAVGAVLFFRKKRGKK